jgi:hypothetical protein
VNVNALFVGVMRVHGPEPFCTANHTGIWVGSQLAKLAVMLPPAEDGVTWMGSDTDCCAIPGPVAVIVTL